MEIKKNDTYCYGIKNVLFSAKTGEILFLNEDGNPVFTISDEGLSVTTDEGTILLR